MRWKTRKQQQEVKQEMKKSGARKVHGNKMFLNLRRKLDIVLWEKQTKRLMRLRG